MTQLMVDPNATIILRGQRMKLSEYRYAKNNSLFATHNAQGEMVAVDEHEYMRRFGLMLSGKSIYEPNAYAEEDPYGSRHLNEMLETIRRHNLNIFSGKKKEEEEKEEEPKPLDPEAQKLAEKKKERNRKARDRKKNKKKTAEEKVQESKVEVVNEEKEEEQASASSYT